jgi:hypothetical protein
MVEQGLWVASFQWGAVRQGEQICHGQDVSIVAKVLGNTRHGLGDEGIPRLALIAFEPSFQGFHPELPKV